jgi:hypothetical protein|tara:strand:- start:71 stop:661 length:591 start_codon:yes stop_codon:yes gene_type:complete
MANQDAAFGLRPLKTLGQADDSTGMSSHKILPGDASVLYQGSMAIGKNDGYVDISAAASTTNVGAFWGTFYIDPTTLKPTFKNYYPGGITPPSSGAVEAFVYDNPQQLFEIQSDNTAASAQTDVFMCADLSTPAGGSTTNGVSSMELADATLSATAAVLKIIGVSRDPANSDLTAANVNWRVMIDQHLFGHNYDGI